MDLNKTFAFDVTLSNQLDITQDATSFAQVFNNLCDNALEDELLLQCSLPLFASDSPQFSDVDEELLIACSQSAEQDANFANEYDIDEELLVQATQEAERSFVPHYSDISDEETTTPALPKPAPPLPLSSAPQRYNFAPEADYAELASKQ